MAPQETRSVRLDPKDPDNPTDYGITAADLLPSGVTLSGAAVVGTSDPAGLTVAAPNVASPLASFRTTGGTAGTDYRVTIRLTFSDGQSRDRTVVIPVRGR
jgi:hypothetical protein